MSLENSMSKVVYQGNGSAKVFSFSFKVWEPSQVRVMLADSEGAETDVTSQVVVALTATGGTVTFGTAPADGTTLAILRSMPFVQEDRYITGTRFDPHEIEEALDIACAERQELREQVRRTVKIQPTSSGSPDDLVLALFNARAEAVSAAAEARQAERDVKAWPGMAEVQSTGSTTPRALRDRFADVVNVKDFGAVGDGVTDDTAAIRLALSKANNIRNIVFFPSGIYRITATIYRDGTNITIDAYGASILWDGEDPYDALSFSGTVKQENVVYPEAINVDSMLLTNVFSSVEAGDLIHIETSQVLDTEPRENWRYGYLVKVNRVSEKGVHLSDPIPKQCYAPKTITATVSSVEDKTAVLSGIDISPSEARVMAYAGGDASNKVYITKWDNETKQATFTTDVSGVLTAGGSLTLVWETKCHVFSPIQVNIRGLHIERSVVTDGKTHRGLRVKYARDCSVENIEIRNFPEACVRLDFCYKTTVRNSTLFGANRIYDAAPYTADGIGYGVQHSGCSFCVVEGCDIKACRGGWSSANATCVTYQSVIKNNTFTAPEGLSYLGERLSPEVPIDQAIVEGAENPLKSYAIGGHGCGLDCIYQGNHIIDYPMGSKERGENPYFLNNTFTGAVYRAINLSSSKGGLVIGNTYDPTRKYKGTAFMRFDLTRVNMDSPVYAENNISVSQAAAMFSFNSFSSQENRIRNFHARGNRVHINGNVHGSSNSTGISGGASGYPLIVDKSCSFAHNTITVDDSIPPANRHGFVGMFYECVVDDNSYTEIDENTYAIKVLAGGGECQIPLKARSSNFVIDVAGIEGLALNVTGIAYSAGIDRNPNTKTYTGSGSTADNRVFITNSADKIVDGRNGVWIYHISGAFMGIRNTSSADMKLLIKLSCGLFA